MDQWIDLEPEEWQHLVQVAAERNPSEEALHEAGERTRRAIAAPQ